MDELQGRGELHVDSVAEPSAQELGVAVQAGHHRGRVAAAELVAAQRLDEHRGVAQVRAHADLGDRHRDAGQRRIVDLFLAQDVHQGVTHEFARPVLALRGPGGARVGLAFHHRARSGLGCGSDTPTQGKGALLVAEGPGVQGGERVVR